MTNEELFKRLSEGDASVRDEIIIRNRPLVSFIAFQFPSFENPAYGIDDMLSIGTIGLLKAVDTFNSSKNIKFSSYAAQCIKNELRMEARKLRSRPAASSLDARIDDDDANTFLDMLSDDSVSIEKEIEDRLMVNDGVKAIGKLSESAQGVMTAYIFSQDRVKQHEVAKKVGKSQSYVSRVIKKSQENLREACGY